MCGFSLEKKKKKAFGTSSWTQTLLYTWIILSYYMNLFQVPAGKINIDIIFYL